MYALQQLNDVYGKSLGKMRVILIHAGLTFDFSHFIMIPLCSKAYREKLSRFCNIYLQKKDKLLCKFIQCKKNIKT